MTEQTAGRYPHLVLLLAPETGTNWDPTGELDGGHHLADTIVATYNTAHPTTAVHLVDHQQIARHHRAKHAGIAVSGKAYVRYLQQLHRAEHARAELLQTELELEREHPDAT